MCDLALAVAEHDGVLEPVDGADQAAQGVALVVRLAAGAHHELAGGGQPGGRFRDLHAHGIVQELLGDAPDLRRHGRGKNRVWRVNGTSLQMRSMSGMNPMSSMRSASSITSNSTPVSSSLPRSK